MACSIGIYQANIPVCLCSLLLFGLADVWNKEESWKDYFKQLLVMIGLCIGFLILYLVVNYLFLRVKGITLSDYKGINSFGVTSFAGYIDRIVNAYGNFLFPYKENVANMYPYSGKIVHLVLNFVSIILLIGLLRRIYKENKNKVIQMAILVLGLPLAAYFIFVMVEENEIHSLMTYGEVFVFAFALWLAEKSAPNIKREKVLKQLVEVIVGVLIVLNVRLSNMCYLKAEILQSQAISYYTTLASEIRTTEGFSDEIPVVYLDEYNKRDIDARGSNVYFDEIRIIPYDDDKLINNYAWKETMALWCGFSPRVGRPDGVEQMDEVIEMPCYPDKGSIRLIDGQIVVKFNGEETGDYYEYDNIIK